MSMILHCISGLPRSGSTLLCNVLAQNPRFYATQTSGLLDVLFGVRNQWDNLLEMRAMDSQLSEQRKLAVLRGIAASFYADVARPIVLDKSRGWLAHLELLLALLQRPPRVLVPVRDLRDVLASFEKLYRAASATRQLAAESANYLTYQTVEQRLEHWTRFDQPVGLAYNRIADALQRGWREHICFVDYDRFCRQPERALREVYAFLDEPWFGGHDFAHVEQVTWEDDTVHGFPPNALHGIRSAIQPQPPQWPTVLGRAAERYGGLELW
jgi:sulfotransferase